MTHGTHQMQVRTVVIPKAVKMVVLLVALDPCVQVVLVLVKLIVHSLVTMVAMEIKARG